ncbi:NfeD family protein [Laspinema sp. A4]|uniref:NfeD family protein n=1 Tax=Laspinema sp. D2d TaxID=2953686 RepID=UPI0021BA9401|nr:NfeD family protein [Laspinema sp. D2d]MCT7982222.1 NfeD family protein [Laspinema sp. D2d]
MKFYGFQWLFGQRFFPRRDRKNTQSAPINSEAVIAESVKRAIVDETIVPYFGGRVRFQHSWWPALCPHQITLSPGEVVYVVGRHNITLLVEPTTPHLTPGDSPEAVSPE